MKDYRGPTRLNPNQINLRQMFSIERILAARGFRVKSEGSARDTVLDKDLWSFGDMNLMFEVFSDTDSRNDLLQTIERPGYQPQTKQVAALASEAGFTKDRQRYSTTFEWFVGELLIRQFLAFSSSFGVTVHDVVRNSDQGTAGDYDVLSVLGDMNVLYLECKTGKCHQDSILNSVERSIGLHCVACVMFLGAGLSVVSLKQQLSSAKHPRFRHSGRFARISIKGVPESEIFRWFDCYFVAAGEISGNVEPRLRTVMRILAGERSSLSEDIKPNPEEYWTMGYEYFEELL
jgi:hypothetical protein